MPLFYFDVRDGQLVSTDVEGTELADLAAAVAEAKCVARDLAIEELKRGAPIDGREIEIRDAAKQKCAAFLVREIIQ
jgi:hypothetical protein